MKKNLFLLFVSLAISLVVAELICRWQGAYLSYNERTGAGGYTSPFETDTRGWIRCYDPYAKRFLKRSEFTDSWTANEDGLKDLNISPGKKGKRILILGDSFTEGVGAPPDSSYPRILESLLHASDSSVQVTDAGIGGSDIFFEYKLLQHLMQKYKPDVVIDATNPTDVIDFLTRGGFDRFLPDNKVQYRQGPWFEPLYESSFLVRRMVHNVFHYNYIFIREKDYPAEVQKAQIQMCVAIDSFQTLCALNHIQFIQMLQPGATDFERQQNYSMAQLANYCRQKNIVCIDELAYLQGRGINAKNWESIYWPVDGHFKSGGYRLLALSLYEYFEKQKMLAAAK